MHKSFGVPLGPSSTCLNVTHCPDYSSSALTCISITDNKLQGENPVNSLRSLRSGHNCTDAIVKGGGEGVHSHLLIVIPGSLS